MYVYCRYITTYLEENKPEALYEVRQDKNVKSFEIVGFTGYNRKINKSLVNSNE